MAKKQRCWVCFATDEDEPMSQWVRPCRCRGTAKWVHQVCLQRWIDEKQGGSSTAKVSCPQCNAEYIIVFPPLGPLLQSVEFVDKLINKFCPIAAAGVVVGSLYWSAVTYGAVTVMQVLGHKEGLEVMEKADPMFLFVGLPTIPLALILGKMVRWEDHVLRLWRRHVRKMSFLNYFLPHLTAGLATRTPAEPTPLSDPVSLTRLLCGALVLPTISTLIGKVGFGYVHSSLHRALLGGMTFVAVKGVVRIYYKQQQYVRQAQRVVKDYEPE
ncbi:E3 ubiquitin-protein ligase MARCHF5-like isoform X2 [Acropora millepora]|uniref:E3 ubiquitin-protein ligase MARCHF5-like isoform X2 n=1 Tax=Acropora millepora TaxID=45264 RepID=UPI0010FCC72F|nr:E3 ubiquitin-protein ligase MARCHF5-like isoform X2 [Acropora millepora]